MTLAPIVTSAPIGTQLKPISVNKRIDFRNGPYKHSLYWKDRRQHVQPISLRAASAAAAAEKSTITRTSSKRVQFGDSTVREITKSPSDIENAWYSINEYRCFDMERKRTVQAFHQVRGQLAFLDPTKYTVAGLEELLCGQQMIVRKYQTRQHRKVVLETQHFQRCTGQYDSESLRCISEAFSKHSGKRAAMRGMYSLDYWVL
jgi:hypothetical protein